MDWVLRGVLLVIALLSYLACAMEGTVVVAAVDWCVVVVVVLGRDQHSGGARAALVRSWGRELGEPGKAGQESARVWKSAVCFECEYAYKKWYLAGRL